MDAPRHSDIKPMTVLVNVEKVAGRRQWGQAIGHIGQLRQIGQVLQMVLDFLLDVFDFVQFGRVFLRSEER